MIKKYALLALLFLCSIFSGFGQSVIISQYIETSSGSIPKGIEIFNVSGSDIVFSATNNLVVVRGSNGAACSWIGLDIQSGTLRADEVWVIGDSTLTSYATTNGTDLSGTTVFSINFNGNDALIVRLGGVVQDMFGLCGTDPGNSWNSGGVDTRNNNLEIKDGICSGDTDGWTDPSVRFNEIAGGTDMTGFGDAPASCSSPSCNITSSGLVNITCGDNGTTTNSTDDILSFDLNVTGTLIATTYSVSVSGGGATSISPTSGTYGSTESFTLNTGSANGSDVTLTITDDTDPTCTYIQNITDNGSCSSGGTTVCLSDNFDASLPPGYSLNGTYRNSGNAYSPTYKIGFNDPGDNLQLPTISNPASLSFRGKLSSGSGSQIKVQYDNGGTWTDVGATQTVTGTSYILYTFNLSTITGLSNVDLRLTMVTDNNSIYLDDLEVTCGTSTSPTILMSPTTLTSFAYVECNGPSNDQVTVQGVNLTDDILLTPPTDYEISDDNSTWVANPSTITLTESGGVVNSTTIYIRLKAGLSLGTYNSQTVTATSPGATDKTVTCDGEVAASSNSDIIAVAASETANILSTTNGVISSIADGAKVWQLEIRDGGASNDLDCLPTILTGFTLAQAAGNEIGTWSDAIDDIVLFNDSGNIIPNVTTTVSATQIQFALASPISAPDNGSTSISIRITLDCPLGPDAFDGEDFMFSLSNANTTFGPTGSGKASFSALTSTNNLNNIDIDGSILTFTSQPTTTGVLSPMSDVVVTVSDTCGNIDTGYTGNITLTSTGTMTGDPIILAAVGGVATFSGIVHTAVNTNRQMTASGAGFTSISSSLYDIINVTVFNPGDLAILAVNTNVNSGTDQIAFVSFVDILVGTTIYLTDNGYERQYDGEWGGTEGVITVTRSGSDLTAGTIIVIESNTPNVDLASEFDVYTCGVLDTNWTKTAVNGTSVGGFNLNSDDDVWIMQGGTWTNSTTHHSTYDGNVLYGWTESGWDTTNGITGGCTSDNDPPGSGCTRWSTIYPGLECYNTVAPPGNGFVKFDDPVDPDFSTSTNSRLDWIALINEQSNWLTFANNAGYNNPANSYDYKGESCPGLLIDPVSTFVDGKWIGRIDTDWFNCGNWDTLEVPDDTVDVVVGSDALLGAVVDINSTYASSHGNLAQTRNLTISNESVGISGPLVNNMEVHGDLLIETSGVLDMDDGDDYLHLYGNWSNTIGPAAFLEGNGTVILSGSGLQTVNVTTPFPPPTYPTEEFYNITLDNSFDTGDSNDLFANGRLLINFGNTLTVRGGDYVQVNNEVINSGAFNIENNGSLVQVDDAFDTADNLGPLSMQRAVSLRELDYVYWSSPVEGFNVNSVSSGTPSANYIYKWNPTFTNPAGGEGYWVSAAGDPMLAGVGYIVRGPDHATDPEAFVNLTATFNTGKPRNGIIDVGVARGSTPTGPTGNDDDWNLVGNPYPSAIRSLDFLNANNTIIEGYVGIWAHISTPSAAISDPFYETNLGENYTDADYIIYNGTATTDGPAGFNGFIAAGQSFMVNMVDGPADALQEITFNNTMRSRNHDNSQFYRQASSLTEKSRIWFDLIDSNNDLSRMVVGYVSGATMERDHIYDAINKEYISQNFYSIIDDDPFIIQGRSAPFVDSDVVPIGMNIVEAGNYLIAIAAVDGIFETENQDIYLKDKLLGFTHHLNTSPYSFTTDSGDINNRFEIVFVDDNALSVNENELDPTGLTIIELPNGEVKFLVPNTHQFKSIEIIDMLGRTLYRLKGNSSFEIYNLSNLSQAAYIAKVELSNGQVITKRAIKRL